MADKLNGGFQISVAPYLATVDLHRAMCDEFLSIALD